MAQTACPIGWRLPTTADWQTLINYAGGENAAGTKLKAIEGWNDNGNGSDDFGFSALPAGAVSPSNEFCDAGSFGWWWRAKNSDEGAAVRMVSREVTSTSSSTLVTLAKRVETTQHATATIITDNVSADNYTPLNRNNTFYLAVRCIKN
ncbi:MAG: hypothetical protein FWC26_11535, partial [Fibromonadales bacterium]|nr:hypothetical protein [Fibromonadales bacterium]